MGAIPPSAGGGSVRAIADGSPGTESATVLLSPNPGYRASVPSELPGPQVGALREARIYVAQVCVADGRRLESERGEQGLPGFVEPSLGGEEHGKVVPWLRHVGVVAPEPVEDLDRFAHAPLVRVQDSVEQASPRVQGIAREKRIERLPRFPVVLFIRQRNGTLEVFFE